MSFLDEFAYSDHYIQSNLDYCQYYCDNYVEEGCQHKGLPDNEYNNYWTHIELGAGNYGLDGHTKIALNKTILMEFKFVSNKPNFIDKLPFQDSQPYQPFFQYYVLFKTLDDLVSKKGAQGIFHVNDLVKEYALYAAYKLKAYAKFKKYDEVIIGVVYGDYTRMIPSKALASFGKTLYDSVQLKNIEESFYHYGMDGDKMLYNDESREHARNKLQQLANLSPNGLYFFPLVCSFYYIPKEEMREYINESIFYNPTQEYESVPYIFPEGDIIHPGSVYHIKHNYKCGGN